MSRLNPNAEPFVPVPPHVRAFEERSLFMTFSHGSPVNVQEIIEHFIRGGYGDYVEAVFVHSGRAGRDPMSGNIVFTSPELPRWILGRQEVTKILVNEKPIWLKKFVPRAHRGNP